MLYICQLNVCGPWRHGSGRLSTSTGLAFSTKAPPRETDTGRVPVLPALSQVTPIAFCNQRYARQNGAVGTLVFAK